MPPLSKSIKIFMGLLFLVGNHARDVVAFQSSNRVPCAPPPPPPPPHNNIVTNQRRNLFQKGGSILTAAVLGGPTISRAYNNGNDDNNNNKAPLKVLKVIIENPRDSIGVQVYNTQLRGQPIVAVQRVIQPKDPKIQEGMILKGFSSAQSLVERLTKGPFPVELEFINLAAGGDAISDVGSSIVTPQDALHSAQQTDDPASSAIPASFAPSSKYTITTTSSPGSGGLCKIQSRRGDVVEFNYQATYIAADGRHVLYDSSTFRGTGQPYQMVLGSGDMIPGVDQGLYDMCPGEQRQLQIPPPLAYGPRARDAFRIPIDYRNLEWQVELVSIDGTIRKDNNDVQTRQEREGRAAY